MINRKLYFSDLAEFWNFSLQDSNARTKESRSNSNLHWAGGLTWEQAKEQARSGWRDGMNEIEKLRMKIYPKIAERVWRSNQVRSIAGYSVEVGSFLSNQPECFITKEFEDRNYPGRIFKIVCSISFSASIKPETIIQRGAIICALIDAIEFAGHRAEVICNDASSYEKNQDNSLGNYENKGWFEISVVVKKSTQALEMSDLAFCLAHPAMLRKIMFSVAEIEGWADYAPGYGYPAEATDKGDIYIREIFSESVTDDKAISWVLDELRKQEIDIDLSK